MHLQNQLIVVVQSRGKYSTSSPATAPEMLATEVTPRLLAGAEPDAHQFYVTMVFMGDQMDRDSGKCHSNSETGSSMYETKEVLI
jgi:hypothetical protein